MLRVSWDNDYPYRLGVDVLFLIRVNWVDPLDWDVIICLVRTLSLLLLLSCPLPAAIVKWASSLLRPQ